MPVRIFFCVASSISRISAQRRHHRLELALRDHHHAVAIAQHDVARLHRDPAADDGEAEPARPAAHARVGRDAAREHRQSRRDDAVAVARHAVGDDGGDALVLGHHGEVVADARRGGEAVAGRDDHVARLRNHQRRHDGEVVVGAALAGQRRADEARLLRIGRLDVMVERAASLQRVDDMAGLRARELGDQLARRAPEGAADGEDRRVFQHLLFPLR